MENPETRKPGNRNPGNLGKFFFTLTFDYILYMIYYILYYIILYIVNDFMTFVNFGKSQLELI